jgi:hypothetical protein
VVTLRNSLRPINRLPPEVLASCATFVSDADPRPIVPLTHVCRYWRESVTSNPRSWASISTGWKELTPLCLERAGAIPLAVDLTVPDVEEDGAFLNGLLPHVSRIGSLRLTGHSSVETVKDELPGFFASPMLELTSLELQQTEEPIQLFPPDDATVPPPFRNVSKLRSLSLTQTPLYPTLFTIGSLVELKLTVYIIPFHFPTLLVLLDSNRGLELVVLDIQFATGSVETTPARKVPLARLHHLSITCTGPTDARGLLSCISLPSGIRLEVLCSGSDPLDAYLPLPPTPIQTVLAPITVVKFRPSPRELHLSGNSGLLFFRSRASRREPELHLFSTTSVREFHMGTTSWSLIPMFLPPALRQSPALETLIFTGASASWGAGAFDSLATQPLLCPYLKTIAFFNCRLVPEVMRAFEDVIAKRKDVATARLYRVIIVNSAEPLPDYALIQRLRKHVPCVDVRMDDKLPDLS